jgi:hypothetical protein
MHRAGRVRRQAAAGTAPAEDPAARDRRMRAIRGAQITIDNIRAALSRGHRFGFERVTSSGIAFRLGPADVGETGTGRRDRLLRLVSDLIAMIMVLERGPAPAAWAAPAVRLPEGLAFGVKTPPSVAMSMAVEPEFQDAAMMYAQRAASAGLDSNLIDVNTYYIGVPPIPVRESSLPRIAEGGVQLGIYIVVPDPDNEPMEYHRLSRTENWPDAETIFEVWHDRFGYYYLYGSRKHYLPERPGVPQPPVSR